jgi:hypothetical protein
VQINLRGGNIRMAEQILHITDAGSAGEKVRGKAVPQGVR